MPTWEPSSVASTAAGDEGPAWWCDAVVYQVYPKSFCDDDGDGIGDLPGITRKLEHLAWLGVDALWISPFYPSPQADGGYDVSDHCDVDPVLGTLADLDDLVATAHRLHLRVVVDLVPNHTSDAHPWFRRALAAGPASPERDLYLFRTGRDGGREPPNNWRSIFGGSAWSRVQPSTGRPDDEDQWYLHTFDASQPDLDWSDPVVRSRFEDVLRFWLDRGIDGFRVDVAHGLVKAQGLPDQEGSGPGAMPMGVAADRHGAVLPSPMFDQDGVHEVYRSWRRLVDSYPGERILVAEAVVEPPERAARYVRADEMHQAFNFEFLHAPWDAPSLREVISTSLRTNGAVGAPTTWVLSNHDVVRHASRLGLEREGGALNGIGADDEQPDEILGLRRARAAALLMLALPGSTYLYQGEELGLPEHTTLDDDLRQDPIWLRTNGTERGRDGCRVPLPWDETGPAHGFSPTGRSWLPQPRSWGRLAVDVQRYDDTSTLHLYRRAIDLRRRHRLGQGHLHWVESAPGVLAFTNRSLLVVVNIGERSTPLPDGAAVVLRSDGGAGASEHLDRHDAVWLLRRERSG